MKNVPDSELFGSPGVGALKLCADITSTPRLREYHFLQNDLFAKITDPYVMQQVYWREMFQYVHWAATLNLLRHKRWQTGCTDAYKSPGNFFSFSANLRGMLESALDASYSLGRIPMSLAEFHSDLQRVFRGERNETVIISKISKEIEDLLIHFVYAKKLDKQEQRTAPASHRALEPKDYRNAIGLPEQDRSAFQQLYDDLCGYCHPTAKGLELLWTTLPTGAVEVTDLDDRAAISGFVAKHIDAIQFAINLSVATSALCLRTMNRFDFPDIRCDAVEQWNFDDSCAWQKIERMLKGG
jgi:hypothetical protein